jgi:multicomponent Na+:H+ antiporter subunit E
VTRSQVVRFGVLVWLTLVWCWLWGHVSIANILAGLVIGVMIMVLLPLPRVPISGRFHLWSFLKLIVLVAYLSLESSVQVAWLAVRPAAPPVTGVLRIRLAIQSDLVLVLCCDVINVIPGTMVLELDRSRRVAYVHVLDVGSEKAVEYFYETTRRIEKAFVETFERPAEWQGPTEIESTEEAGTS